jgi:predicted dehydrogenase
MTKHLVAQIGCSPGRGRDHARAFTDNADRFHLVGLCDRDEERLKALSAEYPVAEAFTDAEEMLARTKPDVLCFVTPPQVRVELIELGIRHKVKAIAYEKPMADELTTARKVYDLCRKAGVKTIVSHQHKYGDHWRAVRKLVENGDLGEIRTIHATAKGPLLHLGTHLTDYMMYLNGGARVKWVVGHVHGAAKLNDPHPEPEYTMAQYEFENGVRGILECGELAPKHPGDNPFWVDAGAVVYGSEGQARAVIGSGWSALLRSSGEALGSPKGMVVPRDQARYIEELADWLDDPQKVHLCNGETTYHGFEAVMGACLSALEHRRVELPLEKVEPVIERMRREL